MVCHMSEERILGYSCELFVDKVPEHYYCAKCSLVARALVFTNCCGESFCQACIASVEICPQCGAENMESMKPLKHLKKIAELKVCCSYRERGCGWSGLLGELDAHLDPGLDNCQYVDVQCPLNCPQAVPKNKVEQHLSKECSRREHSCQHCGFKATYQEVVDTHLPECKYVPVQCPNFCGVTCEREDLEDHMKMCRLEEVDCEFSSVGCEETFTRELQENHMTKNGPSHLALVRHCSTANASLVKEQQKKIFEQEKQIHELETKLADLENKLTKQSNEYCANLYMETFRANRAAAEIDIKLSKLLQNLEVAFQVIKSDKPSEYHPRNDLGILLGYRSIVMNNFSRHKGRDKVCDWMTSVMYTKQGYSFMIGLDANGYVDARGKALSVCLWHIGGKYDSYLKWPRRMEFTIELVNVRGNSNIVSNKKVLKWIKYNHSKTQMQHFNSPKSKYEYGFVDHDQMEEFIQNDTITVAISDITVY